MENFHLIIPALRWATNSSTRFYIIIHMPLLVGISFTRNRGPGIHCRCNLRCKTKSSNQQSPSPWCSAYSIFFCINACQSLSTSGAHPASQANFDNMPARKRGRPLVKWDDKLSHLTHQLFPLHSRWLVAAKFPFWQNARQFFVSHFVDL